MGIITPTERINGRRRSRERHIARVAMMLRGKDAGLSPEQIGDILEAPNGAGRKELLRRHRAELE